MDMRCVVLRWGSEVAARRGLKNFEPHNREFLQSEKTRMFCCDVEKKKSTLRHINIPSIFQEMTSSYVQILLLQGKKRKP